MDKLSGIWIEFLDIVKKEVGSRIVDTWFKAIVLKRWDAIESVVYLMPPNKFVKDWICSNYMDLLNVNLGRLFNVKNINVKFISLDAIESSSIAILPQQALTEMISVKKRKTGITQFSKIPVSINTNFTFDSFVIGPNNSLAHAAALAVTEKSGKLYNPLFIYGGPGLGKTHLLHAIGNQIKLQDKRAQVLYQSADRFVNEFIGAIRFDKIHLFKEKYKTIDVLLIDDIQFFSKKDQTQEAFFHIFNSLYESHKQIVFSSDTYPRYIEGIADRLKSRLESGLIVDIQKPTLETKIAILKRKAELSGEPLPDDIAYYTASVIDSNIRELEGALIRIIAFANLTNQPLSLELAERVLNSVARPKEFKLDLDTISKAVCSNYAVSVGDLKSKSRNKKNSFARQVAMYLMKELTGSSLQEIGSFLNRKDHSTVLHAISKIKALRQKDPEIESKIKLIHNQLV